MLRTVIWMMVWVGISLPLMGQEDTYLILQDDWGGMTGINLSASNVSPNTLLVRPVMNTPLPGILDLEVMQNGACQLFSNGVVLPVGQARLYSGMLQHGQAVKLALTPEGKGGWIASHNYIRPIGQTPQLVFPKYSHPIRDIEYDTTRRCLLILFNNGDAAACFPTDYQWITSLSLPRDETLDAEIRDDELYILTKAGSVYVVHNLYSDAPVTVQTEDIPKPEKGSLLDIELIPNQRGFYLLDSNGIIHSLAGARRVDGQPVSAIDMEILQSTDIPLWYPSGWNTTVSFLPESVRVDPQGPEKIIQLWIGNADNMSSFSSEIHYDPALIEVDPVIEPGSWLESNMRNATLNSQIIPDRKGVLVVQGGGWVTPYHGAGGSGELLKLKLSAKENIDFGTTTIRIQDFTFKDASPLNFANTLESVQPLLIQIAASHPKLSFAWMKDDQPVMNNIQQAPPGSLVRADLLVTEGSRIQSISFDLRYSESHFQYLGMAKGDAWFLDAPVRTNFPLPSQTGHALANIRIIADSPGACRDEPASLLSALFRTKTAVSNRSPGLIRIESLTCCYHNGESCAAETGNLELYLVEN